jgi:hypothetical protein
VLASDPNLGFARMTAVVTWAAKEAVDEPVTAAAYSRPDWMGISVL